MIQYPYHVGWTYDYLIGDSNHYCYHTVPSELAYLEHAHSELTSICQQVMVRNGNYLDRYYDKPTTTFYDGWDMMVLRFGYRDYWHCYPSSEALTRLHELCNHPVIVGVSISVLAPGKHIAPHRSPFPGMLRYQLPLIADDCEITVGGITHRYEEGKAFLFDDYLVHEVTNHSRHYRWALLLDIPRYYHHQWQQSVNHFMLRTMGMILPQ